MDPLSDVLSLLKPQSYAVGGFQVGDAAAIKWPKHEGIKCYAMVSGQCWLSLDGVSEAVLLTAGDCFLLPPGPPFCLATDLSLPPVDFMTVRREMARSEEFARGAAMHDDPGRAWTLQTLAERVGMSRSIFALRFKETVGTSPMEYLTRWRMLLAGDRLRTSGDSIAAIAVSLGYESESAFGKAFRRIMGSSPRQYGRGRSLVGAAGVGAARMQSGRGGGELLDHGDDAGKHRTSDSKSAILDLPAVEGARGGYALDHDLNGGSGQRVVRR